MTLLALVGWCFLNKVEVKAIGLPLVFMIGIITFATIRLFADFPVYKNLGFTLGSQDNFVNNPPFGYRKNTFQFTAGLTYSLK